MDRLKQFTGATTLALATLGCVSPSQIDDGDYEARTVMGHDPADEAELLETRLSIDREGNTATFTLADDTELTASFDERPRAEWPSGCPTMHGDTEMEVLVLDLSPLTIASLEFVDPVLVAACPADSEIVVLTEDFGGGVTGGGPCSPDGPCLEFSPI